MSNPVERPVWSSDVPVSMPSPPKHPVRVAMYGFGFTEFGIAHDLTDAEYTSLRVPIYSPQDPTVFEVFGDADLERDR